MRYLISIMLLLASCGTPQLHNCLPVHDTIYIAPPAHTCVRDTVWLPTDTVILFNGQRGPTCDSLRRRLNTAEYKLQRIRYYVGICNRNPDQSKFLRGWLNRVVE